MDLSISVKGELTAILTQYASGNAEVVATYFNTIRTRELDILWLRHQLARELSTAWKFLDNLNELRSGLDRDVPRKDYEGLARAFLEELEHYRLFAEILEQEYGEPVEPAHLLRFGVWSEEESLPANSEKARFEQELRRSDSRMVKIALGIGEGGGSGWLIAGSRISGGPLDQHIARVMGEIAADEQFHGPTHIAAAADEITTEAELEEVKDVLIDYLRYHLRMKNEQFGNPLTEERMAEIDAGKIDPLPGVDFSPVDQRRGSMAAYAL